MKCLQAEVPGWGQEGFTAGRVRLWVLRREQRLAGWVEGVDRLKRRNGAVQRGESGGVQGSWEGKSGEGTGVRQRGVQWGDPAHRGAPALSPDTARLLRGTPGFKSREAGFQSLESGGCPGQGAGLASGWSVVSVVCGRAGMGPRWKDGLPAAQCLIPATRWGLSPQQPPSPQPTGPFGGHRPLSHRPCGNSGQAGPG